MGNRVGNPPVSDRSDDTEDEPTKFGDLLAGRLSDLDLDVDSVEAVREHRKRR